MLKANYITVSEFKEYAPEVDTSLYADTTISGMIAQASDWIDKELDYSLMVEEVTDEKVEGLIDSQFNLVIYPRKIPVVSVSSVKVVKGTAESTISLTSGDDNTYDIPSSGYRIEFAGGDVSLTSDSIWIDFASLATAGFFTKVNYRAGYTTIPDALKRATILIVKDVFSGLQNTGGAESIRQGGISVSYPSSQTGESDLVRDAKYILRTYKRPSLL